VATVISAGASLYSGITSYSNAFATASLLKEQGELTKADYYRQAKKTRDEGYRFEQEQTMAYISAGVEMQGTPLLMANETKAEYTEEAYYQEQTGNAYESLYNQQAAIKKREGVAELVSGIVGMFG